MSTIKQANGYVNLTNWATFLIACVFFVSCNPPANGDDPGRRDNIGDPVTPADTAGGHPHTDSVRDDREAEW